MNHFFIPPSSIQGDIVIFPRDVSAQISNVLRLKSGNTVLVLDDLGSAFEVELDTVSGKETTGCVIKTFPAANEPRIRVQLQICLTQREKFEWILQKGTELGVSEFMPVLTSRTIVQRVDDVLSKMDRWRKILKEAAEQCERGRIPVLLPPMGLNQALMQSEGSLAIILNEDENHTDLKQELQDHRGVAAIRMLIGPEGGFAEAEVDSAKKAGYQSVTLGSRILRMETAAVAAVTVVMYEMGELSRPSE